MKMSINSLKKKTHNKYKINHNNNDERSTCNRTCVYAIILIYNIIRLGKINLLIYME